MPSATRQWTRWSPTEIRHVFYSVCIPARLALATAASVLLMAFPWPVAVTATALSGTSLAFLLRRATVAKDVWWYRTPHMTILLLILAVSVINIAKGASGVSTIVPVYWIGIFMYLDVVIGVAQSYFVPAAFGISNQENLLDP